MTLNPYQYSEREKELVGLLAEKSKDMGGCTGAAEVAVSENDPGDAGGGDGRAPGDEKHSNLGDRSGNSQNGYGKKRVKSEYGELEISVPRDRNGSFEPQVIEKRQTKTDDLESRVIAMYAKGMSNRDIEDGQFSTGQKSACTLESQVHTVILP